MTKRSRHANTEFGWARATIGWPEVPHAFVQHGVLTWKAPSRRVKVAHVITRFIDGAGGNTLISLVGAVPQRYETWLIGAPGGPLWERAERHGVKTVKLKRMREVISPIDDLLVLIQLVRLIRRERFSIVHTHSSKAGFLGRLAAWLCGTPVVVHTIHGVAWHDFMSPVRYRFYVALERIAGSMTDAFLAVAPQVAREVVEQRVAPARAVSVVPSAVELETIPTDTDPRIRLRLGVPSDVPLVGTVGRFDFQKAPLDFVRMAGFVAASHPETRFVMVGEGELMRKAQLEARRLGLNFLFAGYRDDASAIAACFDVYVVPSLYEGLGRALTEALASARPVAATAVNGVVDIIEPRATGLLSPPADPEALAANVVWLLDHPREARAMGEAARARVRALFDPRLMCGLIDDTYRRLLGWPQHETVGRGAETLPSDRAVADMAGR